MENSNDLGNKLYEETLKCITKTCDSKHTRMIADFVLERVPVTQIFNLTDIVMGTISDSTSNPDNISDWIKDATDINTVKVKEGLYSLDIDYTPYIDDVFVYSGTENGMYYGALMHRVNEKEALVFFGTLTESLKYTIFNVTTIEIQEGKLLVDFASLYNSVRGYIAENDIRDLRTQQYLISSLDICYIGTLSIILKTFKELTNKGDYKCYVDTVESSRAAYFRSPLTKKVTKATDKPIILVLRDTKDSDVVARKHARRQGKIHYAFSWIVRGHYRRLTNPEHLGLDRTGKRCVPGFTWIETYLKGDVDMPLLKRERKVVKGK